LRGLGSSSSGCFGILAATVPACYLDSRVLAEPPGESVSTPVRYDVYQHVTLEIHQDCTIAGSPAKSDSSTLKTLGVSNPESRIEQMWFSRVSPETTTPRSFNKREPAPPPRAKATCVKHSSKRSFAARSMQRHRASVLRRSLFEKSPPHRRTYGGAGGRLRGSPARADRPASLCNENGPCWIASRTPDRELYAGGGFRDKSDGALGETNTSQVKWLGSGQHGAGVVHYWRPRSSTGCSLLPACRIYSPKARKNRFGGPIRVKRSGSVKRVEEDGQERQALLA
jgi:hypothetical protein